MKKAVSIFAVLVMSFGLFSSCEEDKNMEETQALYENLNAGGDDHHIEVDRRQ